MGEYKHLFGPVPSRRLGRSLGVDLTPHKTCSQDCVFCQLGRTAQTTVIRQDYVSVAEVIDELEAWLHGGGRADHITLSGSGEPTLHSRFGEILEFVRSSCRVPAVLLTNGTMLYLQDVRDAACKAQIVKVSLSAWDQASYEWVNRPHPELDFNRLIEGQKAFRAQFTGEMWMEVFLIPGINSAPSDVGKVASLARQIGPDRIHLNTAVRPPAEDFVAPLSMERLISLSRLFHPRAEVVAGYEVKGDVGVKANEEAILSMLNRRPCMSEEIAAVFGMHLNEVSKYLGSLMRKRRIREERVRGAIYYVAVNKQSQRR